MRLIRVRQLAKIPSVIGRSAGAVTDLPEDADIYETKLRDGDLVIAYVRDIGISLHRLTDLCLSDGRVVRQRLQSRNYLHLQSGISVRRVRRGTGKSDL